VVTMGFDHTDRYKVERVVTRAIGLALWLTGELELDRTVVQDYCSWLRAMVLVVESILSEEEGVDGQCEDPLEPSGAGGAYGPDKPRGAGKNTG